MLLSVCDRRTHLPPNRNFLDHLPLYRQEQIFALAGVRISRSTLAEWVGLCGLRLQSLVDAMRDLLLKEPVLHADETPVPMLAPGKKKTHRATSGPMRPRLIQR